MIFENRNNHFDIIKGLGIILVVLGHSGFFGTQFIYLFHMAIFFILSGVLFKPSYSDSIASSMMFIKKRIKRLYKPYLLWNLFYLCLTNLFIFINIYIEKPNIINSHSNSYRFSFVQHISIHNLFSGIINIFTFGNIQQLSGVSWFLVVLFTISIWYLFIDYILKRFKLHHMICHACISIIFLLIGFYLSAHKLHLPRMLDVSFSLYFLFFIGVAFNKTLLKKFYSISVKSHISIIFISFLILMLLLLNGKIELNNNQYTNPFFLLASSIFGWFFIYSSAYILMLSKNLSKVLSYIGKLTIPIMFLHFLSFKLISILQIKLYDLPDYTLASFPVIYSPSSWWMLYTLTGILIPLIITYFYTKLRLNLSQFYLYHLKN